MSTIQAHFSCKKMTGKAQTTELIAKQPGLYLNSSSKNKFLQLKFWKKKK